MSEKNTTLNFFLDWSSFIVGKISPYINVDSNVESIRHQSEYALEQELGYACHLGVPAVLLNLKNGNVANLARILYTCISGIAQYQIWIQVPMQSPSSEAACWRNDYEETEPSGLDGSTWEW